MSVHTGPLCRTELQRGALRHKPPLNNWRWPAYNLTIPTRLNRERKSSRSDAFKAPENKDSPCVHPDLGGVQEF